MLLAPATGYVRVLEPQVVIPIGVCVVLPEVRPDHLVVCFKVLNAGKRDHSDLPRGHLFDGETQLDPDTMADRSESLVGRDEQQEWIAKVVRNVHARISEEVAHMDELVLRAGCKLFGRQLLSPNCPVLVIDRVDLLVLREDLVYPVVKYLHHPQAPPFAAAPPRHHNPAGSTDVGCRLDRHCVGEHRQCISNGRLLVQEQIDHSALLGRGCMPRHLERLLRLKLRQRHVELLIEENV
mmetsp:Transcript_11022/g.36576  ORF Transcript_11022/g.36576 Transcript_11022/m.36576 type:complete len:238 (-) Transcript_11022:2819-3532(-)